MSDDTHIILEKLETLEERLIDQQTSIRELSRTLDERSYNDEKNKRHNHGVLIKAIDKHDDFVRIAILIYLVFIIFNR